VQLASSLSDDGPLMWSRAAFRLVTSVHRAMRQDDAGLGRQVRVRKRLPASLALGSIGTMRFTRAARTPCRALAKKA
jgi:hypothetical protein